MKTKIAKIEIFNLTKLISLLFIIFTALDINETVYSQENECDAVQQRNEWFYGQRKFPFDSIPADGYANAIAQKNALISNNGYQLTGPNGGWTSIGPQPFQPDASFGTIASGRVAALVYDKRDNTGMTIYIAGAGGGVWKTTDGGSTWLNITGDLPTLISGAIAIDSVHGIIYYGSGSNTYFGTGYMGMGMFKTTDEQHWTQISNGLQPQTQIFRIAVSPNDVSGNTIFIAEAHGLYKTVNGGGLWTKVLPVTGFASCTDVCFSPSGNKVYAIGPSPDFFAPPYSGIGYNRSTDGGNNFIQIGQSSGFPHTVIHYGRSHLAVSNNINAEDILYMMSYDDAGLSPIYVYKSVNGGLNFTSYNYYISIYENWNMGGNAGANEVLRCSDQDSNVCFMGFQDLYKTADGNQSWVKIGGYSTQVHPDFHSFDINPFFPNKVTAGSDGGIYNSTNLGGTWSNMNQNLSLAQIWRVASNTYNPNIIVAGLEDEGIGYKDPNTSPTYWRTVGTAYYCDGGLVLASPFKSNYFVGGLAACRQLHYSSDGINFPLAQGYYGSSAWIAPTVNHPSQPGVLFTIRSGGDFPWYSPFMIFKSTDYGANWALDGSFDNTNLDHNKSPQALAICPSNPNKMFMAVGNPSDFWHTPNKIYRLDFDGINWTKSFLVVGGTAGVDDRYFSHIEVDSRNENEIYLTLSGYGTGHIFRSTNGGVNWSNITENLPDNPTNDLKIHYNSSTSKELIVSCDVGVYRTDANNISWRTLASGLPSSPVLNLDHNRLSGLLTVSTSGRGVWQVPLGGPIYVQDQLYITDNVTLSQQIVVCNGGKLILGHSSLPGAITLNFTNNANIIVQNGGQIDASTGNSITLAGLNGSAWGGIQFQGSASGTLTNCTFNNTETPIAIDGSTGAAGPGGSPGILISNCTFNNGSVTSSYRDNVTITGCITNTASSSTGTGIFVNYGNSIAITGNHIHNTNIGISVSNSSPFLVFNTIDNSGDPNSAITGISMDNSYSSTVSKNTVTGYQKGIYLYNSSPTMYQNTFVNDNSAGDATVSALYANYLSSPRLTPTVVDGAASWDAGLNILKSNSLGNGIYMWEQSRPNTDYGYNTIFGYNNYIFGWIGDPFAQQQNSYYTRDNCWVDPIPDPNKFKISDADVYYDPYTCSPPGGGGESGKEVLNTKNGLVVGDNTNNGEMTDDPVQFRIIDYGNGVYDTIRVTNHTSPQTADQVLFSQAVDNELNGNYTSAITKYHTIIQNYRDSTTAITSMKKIIIL